MCPRHRKEQVAWLRGELWMFLTWAVLLGASALMLPSAPRLVVWLWGGAFVVVGLPVQYFIRRHRNALAEEIERVSRTCSACAALR